MTHELYKKYRPKRLEDVVGQEIVVRTLRSFLKSNEVPHAILFSGNSGTGKTTLARIMARELGATGMDLAELNCADFRGVDTVRDIRTSMHMSPAFGKCRVWIIDEVHQMMGTAQEAMLKILEDCPPRAYFFLATTDPNKLRDTIRNRCTPVATAPIDQDQLADLMHKIASKEEICIDDAVVEKIAEVSEGSARKCLVLLDQASRISGAEDQLKAISRGTATSKSIDLARALVNQRTTWDDVRKILSEIEDEPESVRYAVLGYARSVLLGKAKPMYARCYLILEAFSENYFDTKAAGLVRSCYDVVSSE